MINKFFSDKIQINPIWKNGSPVNLELSQWNNQKKEWLACEEKRNESEKTAERIFANADRTWPRVDALVTWS